MPADAHDEPSPPDTALLQAWRGGDLEAGNALFVRHYAAMARFFHNKVDREADDLIQRVFLACVEGRERFEGRSSFRTYLFAIAHNVLRRHLRTRIRRAEPDALDSIALHDLGPSASTMMARTQDQRALLTALRRVPFPVQVLMELHYWERMTAREIAEVLGVPLATLKTQLHRGRHRVLQALQAVRGGDRDGVVTTTDDLQRWADELQARLRD